MSFFTKFVHVSRKHSASFPATSPIHDTLYAMYAIVKKMTEIKITFNSGSYISTYMENSIKLISSFKHNEKIQIESKIENIVFENRFDLLNLFEKLRGCDNSRT